MITITTGKTPELSPPLPPTTGIDPGRLDRLADIMVSQGFPRQGERLAGIAAVLREAAQ